MAEATQKENSIGKKYYLSGTLQSSARKPLKGFSGIPVPTRKKSGRPLQDAVSKLNTNLEVKPKGDSAVKPVSSSGNIKTDSSCTPTNKPHSSERKQDYCKLTPVAEVHTESFVQDPSSLHAILKTPLPVKDKKKPNRHIPWNDDPIPIRLSFYQQMKGRTPSSANHGYDFERINYLSERIVQSTIAMCNRVVSRSRNRASSLEDLKVNLDNQLETTPMKKDYNLIHSPSLPDLNKACKETRCPTQISSVKDGYNLRSAMILPSPSLRYPTPKQAAYKTHLETRTDIRSHEVDYIGQQTPNFYDIDEEIVSILKFAPKPSGLSRKECENPIAKLLL